MERLRHTPACSGTQSFVAYAGGAWGTRIRLSSPHIGGPGLGVAGNGDRNLTRGRRLRPRKCCIACAFRLHHAGVNVKKTSTHILPLATIKYEYICIYIYGCICVTWILRKTFLIVHARMPHVLTLPVIFNHACGCFQCKRVTMPTHSLNSMLVRFKTCMLKAHEHDSAQP